MSLKAFHIFFVCVCVVFLVAFGGWSIREYARVDGIGNLVMALLSFILAVVLIVYGKWFLAKLKGVE